MKELKEKLSIKFKSVEEKDNKIICEEIQYSREHFDDNFYLFLQM